jgi:hypothetical protein
VGAIELWDTQDLADRIVQLGQTLRIGKWFFMPDNRFSGGMFEQHGSIQLATTAGEARTGSLGQYLGWALSDPQRPLPVHARAALRVERPTADLLRPLREGCDEAAKGRASYEDPAGDWVEPCSAVARVYVMPMEPALELPLSQLQVSQDDQRLLWFEGEGDARQQRGELALQDLMAFELSFFPGPLGLVVHSLAAYIDRMKWLRWSVYVWSPAALVPFDAAHGQLTTDDPPHFLVERAFVSWDALESVEVEAPGALDGLFGVR